jgi:uncharacterized protein (DUF305 family)
MSYDWMDDSVDHEAERMISEIRLSKWLAKLKPPEGLSWIGRFAWMMQQQHAQALRMKRHRARKKAGLVPPPARKLTPAQKRARNRKHAQAYRDRQEKKPKPDRRASYKAWRNKRNTEEAAEAARREAQEDAGGE